VIFMMSYVDDLWGMLAVPAEQRDARWTRDVNNYAMNIHTSASDYPRHALGEALQVFDMLLMEFSDPDHTARYESHRSGIVDAMEGRRLNICQLIDGLPAFMDESGLKMQRDDPRKFEVLRRDPRTYELPPLTDADLKDIEGRDPELGASLRRLVTLE